MPALRQVADEGLRYNAVPHTAPLLADPGRPAHRPQPSQRPLSGPSPRSPSATPATTASSRRARPRSAEILKGNGYNTAWFGKNHITPMWEISPAGPFDRWPTGLGFERFYGFMGGEASQWEPSLLDQTTPINPHVGQGGLSPVRGPGGQGHRVDPAPEDLRARTSPSSSTSRRAPGTARIMRPKEWIEKFKGQFDQGWDALRDETHQRQLEAGDHPRRHGPNTPRPESLPSWEEYPDKYKPVASRLMEVYAGLLAHVDHHIGRIIESIKELDAWDNTIFMYIVGDNGASAEGTLHGVWSALRTRTASPKTWIGCWSTWRTSVPRIAKTTTTRPGPGRWTRRSSGPSRWPRTSAARATPWP